VSSWLGEAWPARFPESPGSRQQATKGALVKRLADTGAVLETVAELVAWGAKEGYEFDPASHHEGRIDLVISGS